MIYFILSILICGIKFPWNWYRPDAKFRDIRDEGKFGLYTGAELSNAWLRIRTNYNGRGWFHNVTNLAIEWNRQWLPLSTKFFSFLVLAELLIILFLITLLAV